MANRPAKVTRTEIERAVKGAIGAGVNVGRIEVDHATGKVVIFPTGQSDNDNNPCDRLLE